MTNLLRKLKKLHQQRLIQLIQHLQTPLNLLQLLQTHQLLTTVLNKTLLLLKNNLKLLKLLKKPDLQEYSMNEIFSPINTYKKIYF